MSEAMRAVVNLYNDPRFYDESRLRSINNRIRRERQLRRRVTTFIVITAVVLSLTLFLSYSFLSDASSDNEHVQYRYYNTVTVTSGDSIWSIASENIDRMHYRTVDEYVNDIASVNRISPNARLKAGTNLIVPYYSDELK